MNKYNYCELCLKDGIKVEAAHHYKDRRLCVYHYYVLRKRPSLDSPQCLFPYKFRHFARHHPIYAKRLREQYKEFDELLKQVLEE